MARLSEEKINQILESVDIVDVISMYLNVEKKGRDYKAVCPFHDDTNPSLSISPSRQIYKCFVCGAGGNAFTFLQEYLNISYLEAVKKVAEIGGIDVSELNFSTPVKPIDQKLKPLYAMHEEAIHIYRHLLNTRSGLSAHEYLTSRHIDEKLIDKFSIGYAGIDNQLYKAFKNLNYSELDMARSGLVIEGEHSYFDRYRDRIMFALHDDQGRVIGFSGRLYHQNDEGAKYINSPESDIFIKSKTLYNYHRSKEAIKKAGFVYLLEGFMDVIALSKIGIDNTLALMGTALTVEHVKMIRKLTNTVYLTLDGDKAGQNAAIKSAKLLANYQFNVKMVKLMDGLDPDEILEQFGQETLNISLNTLISPIEFEINHLYETVNLANYEEKREFLEKSCMLIRNIDNMIDLQYYEEMIANKSGFDLEFIKEYMRSLNANKQKISPVTHQETIKKHKHLDKYEKAERHLLFYMLLDKQAANQYEQKIGFMFDDTNRVIASYIVDYYRQHDSIELSSFISYINNKQLVEYILEICDEQLPQTYNSTIIEDYIDIMKKQAKTKEIEQLKKQMARELDVLKKAELAKMIQDLQNN